MHTRSTIRTLAALGVGLAIGLAGYFLPSREHNLGRALLASALANAASFGAGLLLG